MNNKHFRQTSMPGEMQWWKMLAISLFSFGVIAAVVGFLPPYSLTALIVGIVLAIAGSVSSAIRVQSGSLLAWISTSVAATLLFFILGVRFLLISISGGWLWVLPFGVGYIVAWFVPLINPKLSTLIWREQITPETRLGRGVLKVAFSILPIVGAGGAFLGMYASRYRMMWNLGLIFGPLMMLAAIGWGQAASHQIIQKYQETDDYNHTGGANKI